MLRRQIVTLVVAIACVAGAGCGGSASVPTTPSSAPGLSVSAPRPAERCANVAVEGVAPLGVFNGALGAAPTTVTIAGVTGSLGSVVTSLATSGQSGQGAQHITLRHDFVSAAGSFSTEDKAVCAPAGGDPNVCRVNDVMQVASGTGVFANATGQLVNHGVIDLNAFTLTYSTRGRVCGDGL